MAVPIIVRPVIRSGPEAKKPHDWLAISLSILSLSVSCLSLYFSALLQTDDIRVVVDEIPTLSADGDGSLLIAGAVKLTWVNSGNRAASILAISAVARRLDDSEKSKPTCIGKTPPNEFSFGIESFVLKPGEIISVRSKRISAYGVEPKKSVRDDTYVMTKSMYTPAPDDSIYVCILTKIVTPDDFILDRASPVYRYTFQEMFIDITDEKDKKSGKSDVVRILDAQSEPLFETTKPLVLVGNNRWLEKLRSIFGISGSSSQSIHVESSKSH